MVIYPDGSPCKQQDGPSNIDSQQLELVIVNADVTSIAYKKCTIPEAGS